MVVLWAADDGAPQSPNVVCYHGPWSTVLDAGGRPRMDGDDMFVRCNV